MLERTPTTVGCPTGWDLPLRDLDEGIDRSARDLETLWGARVLVTGGTGFLGSWLVSSLIRAEARLRLGLRLVVLSRDPSASPLQESSVVTLLRGDVRTLPEPGAIDVVVHGAATSSAPYGRGEGEPRSMALTIVRGTEAVLEVAARRRARVLFLSSGAVYGPQTTAVSESCSTAPNTLDPRSAYAQAKRLAETLCAAATTSGEADARVARLFALVGPRIPLDAHFAAGNFLRDALTGHAIEVQGDGRPLRSYLYAGDLPEWCWAILARGRSGAAYNVGSPEEVTIEELARRTARLPAREVAVRVHGTPCIEQQPSWYVPVTDLAEVELGLRPRRGLDGALRATFDWLVQHRRFGA